MLGRRCTAVHLLGVGVKVLRVPNDWVPYERHVPPELVLVPLAACSSGAML